jgi:hypothetical protein
MVLFRLAALVVTLALPALAVVRAVQADSDKKKDPAGDRARHAVEAWLDRTLKGDEPQARAAVAPPHKVEAVDLECVRKAFPEDRFYGIHFRKLPRPDMIPKAVRGVKLVRARADGSVEKVGDLEALKKLIAGRFSRVRDREQAREALLVSLRLAEEYQQDGEMTFVIPEDSIKITLKDNHLLAEGKARTIKGGKGEIDVSLKFEPSGALKPDEVKISGRVLPDRLLR